MDGIIKQSAARPPKVKKAGLEKWLGEGLRQFGLFPALQLYTPLRVSGLENLVKVEQAIFAANHSSHLDTPLLLAALPLRLRMRIRVAAAAEYFFNEGWKGALVGMVLNAFPLVRKGPGKEDSLLQVQHILDEKHSLLIFPEGTRTRDGQLQPFKRGLGWLATTTEVQVIPVWIEGTHAAMPKGSRWPCRHPVSIRFGQALRFAPGSDPVEVSAEVERQVRALSSEV